MSKGPTLKIYPAIPGDQLEWRAGPDVARALGMTTETLYPWLDAMQVDRMEIAHSKVLVYMPALAEALSLWHRHEKGEELELDELNRLIKARQSSKHVPKPLWFYYAKVLKLEWNPHQYQHVVDAYNALIDVEQEAARQKAHELYQARHGRNKSKKGDQ